MPFTTSSENGGEQFLFGVVPITPGYLVVRHIIHWILHGGAMPEVEAFLVVPAIIGVTLVVDALRRGYYLKIRRTRGSAKIPFDHRTSLADADQFCDALRAAGYVVVTDVER